MASQLLQSTDKTLAFSRHEGRDRLAAQRMRKDFLFRFSALFLALLTLAAIIFGGINYFKERTKEAQAPTPFDGVSWVETGIIQAQSVLQGSAADKAGIQAGDVVVEIDGRKINTNRELIDYISYLPVGSKVNITVIRNGQRKTLTATTAERPLEPGSEEQTENAAPEPSRFRLGMSVQDLTPQLRQMYGIDDNVKGVVVTNVKEVSPAGDVVNEGDVITEIQGHKIANVSDFRAAIDGLKSGQTVPMYVITPGRANVRGYRFLKVP